MLVSVCGTESRGFESRLPPKDKKVLNVNKEAVSSYFEIAFFMSKFKKFLLNEYGNEYDFKVKKQFSEPKIYDANGDLLKRWYVYFSFRNPNSGKLERQKPLYVSLKLKTRRERMTELKVYQSALIKLLEKGYSPFDSQPFEMDQQKLITTSQAIEFALNIKKGTLNDASFKKYRSRINQFSNYVEQIGYDVRNIKDINKKIVNSFLNEVLKNTSASNRNNSRRELNSLFNVMLQNEIIETNCVEHINKLKTQAKKNKSYTKEEAAEIYKYLKIHDPQLLLFVKFVSYNFLRPIEICRLKVKDIDLKNKTLTFKAKNKPTKTKILVDLLLQDLPNIEGMNPEFNLFTPDGVPGIWETELENKRGYFTKRYSKIKTKLGFSADHGIYSFRHTFTTKVYRKLRETMTTDEAESNLMMITGHTTRSAMKKYLREIDAELPEDYTHLIE